MLFTAYPKNSVTIAVEPFSVMLFFVACAVAMAKAGWRGTGRPRLKRGGARARRAG